LVGAVAPLLRGSFSQRFKKRIGALPMNDLEGFMAGRASKIGSDSPTLKRSRALAVVVMHQKHLAYGVEHTVEPIELFLECGPSEARALAGGKIGMDVGQPAAAVHAREKRSRRRRERRTRTPTPPTR